MNKVFRVIFLSLVIGLLISCAQEKKTPIEGAWQMVYAKWTTYEETFPSQIRGGQMKIFSKENFVFAGQFSLDTLVQDNYGGGTFTLTGNRFDENVLYHANKFSVGKKIRVIVQVQNDTLIQKWPADENWNLPEQYGIEKYVRMK